MQAAGSFSKSHWLNLSRRLAVVLHLFSISAGSAEICIGIKDEKGQKIGFPAFTEKKYSRLNGSLIYFDCINAERKSKRLPLINNY